MILTIIDKIIKIIFFVPVAIFIVFWNEFYNIPAQKYDTWYVLKYWWNSKAE